MNNMEQNKLITIADLAKDDLDQTLAKRNKMNELLNCPPRESWVKKHPMVKVKNPVTKQQEALQYIPVTTVRTLMKILFQSVRREIKSVTIQANGFVAIVRVHYKDPITGEWEWQDGVGGAPIQLDAGANADDTAAMKKNAAQIGPGAAVSYAYKNACEEIGKIFGSDLQKSGIPFVGLYGNEENQQQSSGPTTPIVEDIQTQF